MLDFFFLLIHPFSFLNIFFIYLFIRFPRWLSGKESTCQCRKCKFDPSVRKILWRRKWQPILVFLPGKLHGQRSLAGSSPWVSQGESDTTEQLKNKQLIYLAAPGLSFRIWDLVPRPGDQTPVLGSSVQSLATGPPGKSPAYSSLNGSCCLLPDTHLLETFVGLIVLASTVG